MTLRLLGTNSELATYMRTRTDLTDLELLLFDRLTSTLDEVDALSLDLAFKEGLCGDNSGG